MLKWISVLLGSSPKLLQVGSRVMTPHGAGVVTNGTACVDLDAGTYLRPNAKCPRVNVTVTLDKLS